MKSTNTMKRKSFIKRYIFILSLVGLFVTPGLAAYICYSHPTLLQKFFPTTTNKGYLLNPPMEGTTLGTSQKWHLVVWQPVNCDVNCLKELDTLARIRLALGRHFYQIDQWLLLGNNTETLLASHQKTLETQAIQIKQLSQSDADKVLEQRLGTAPRIFLANPDNYFILTYSVETKPDAIFHDLQQLIK